MNEALTLLRFSEAISRLSDGMWGGLPRPLPVQAIKRVNSKLSIGFGPQREQAGRSLTAAALQGELPVYLHDAVLGLRAIPVEKALTVISPDVLRALIKSRGSLPDHPMRPTLQSAEGDMKLLKLLSAGILVVRASEFDIWYWAERKKGRWPSQHSRSQKIGRPSKQTELLRNAIVSLVRDGKWSCQAGPTELHRLLRASGRTGVPATGTLSRLVDRLHRETGIADLLRRRRRSRSSK